MLSRTIWRRALTLALITVVACEIPSRVSLSGNEATRLDVSPKLLTLQQNQAADFTAVGFTSTGDTADVAINWSTTSGSITDTTTINGKHHGRFKAGSDTGKVKIVVRGKSGGPADTATVTVTLAPVTSILVSPAAASVAVGQTVQLTATPQDVDGNPLSGRVVTWASTNQGVATVNGSGLVTGVAAGVATVTVACEGQSSAVAITVTVVPVASVSVSPAAATVLLGQTVQLTATPKDANGSPLTGRAVTWASSAPGVASVSASGLVTGVAPGTATLTATSEGQSSTSAISVAVVPVASVTVTPGSSALRVGGSVQLSATTKDSAGNVLTGRSVTWSSSAPAVATVSAGGMVSAVAPGSATITATSEGKSGTASVTVDLVPVATVMVSPASNSLMAGATAQLTATTKDSAGNVLTGRIVTWSSSAPAVATVSASGLVTGVAAGSATITATSEGKSGTSSITVTVVPVASVTVAPATKTLQIGTTVQLTATTKDSAGNVLTGRSIAWSSSAPAVATVSASGLVIAVAVGSATITVTSEGKSGTAAITVTVVTVASVTVSPSSGSVSVGSTLQLTAVTKDSAGNVLTGRTVTWSSSAVGVGTVSTGGLVTGIAAGSSTITATSGLVSGSATVTVTASSGSGPITNPLAVLTEPTLAKPAALSPIFPSPFNLKVTRIVGDPGSSFTMSAGGSGSWGSDARHHYSDDQPWNADGTLLMLQNSGSPGDVLLDGATYAPYKSGCSDGGYGRWVPTLAHKYERVSNEGGTLFWYDVRTCATTRSWNLPFSATADIEMGASNDGRYIALSNGQRVFVVDMDPQAPFAPYPNQRIGPAYDYSNCGVSSGCQLDWTQVSASGKYVIVHFEGDWQQVLDVNPTTLALTPRAMPSGSYRCHGTAAQGFIEDLGHPDVTLNPFDSNEDVVIGQEHCGNIGSTVNGQLIGGVMMVRLRDGAITSLSDPTNEAYPYHISARNLDRPGWVYVTYWPSAGERFNDELVAVKLDGSGSVERYAHSHSNSSGCYRCEPHSVPARDGRRILWASTWTINGTGGSSSVTQAYVLDAR